MGQARVSGAGKDDFRETKLLHSPQSLEGARLNNAPKRIVELPRIELDESVQRVANTLSAVGHRQRPGTLPATPR